MNSLIINGPTRIQGSIRLSGNKNAALPMVAAAMLCPDDVILHNVPDILDLRNMLAIAQTLGANTHFANGTLRINSAQLRHGDIPEKLCSAIRASLLFAGPLCARFGTASLFAPGGDIIGRRRLDTHCYGLKKLGIESQMQEQPYRFSRPGALRGADLFLDEASVTATEHIMMTACLAQGRTTIRNAACEPHVTQVAELLKAMGAKISGLDTNRLCIDGVEKLHGAEFTIAGDHVEAASYLALCAATRGKLEIHGHIAPHDYWMTRRVFERFGANFTLKPNFIAMTGAELKIRPDLGNAIPVIADGPWPQFPSDMLSGMIAMATQCQGTVLFFEKMFESRMYFVDKLIAMGANAVACDPHRVVITGPTPLHGITMASPDIRAGMAMIIAACCAHGRSVINNAAVIQRGYEDFVGKLRALGVEVQMQ
jgi:UDP-N-acetylglucosamine 1-carboxyvinyltransferase